MITGTEAIERIKLFIEETLMPAWNNLPEIEKTGCRGVVNWNDLVGSQFVQEVMDAVLHAENGTTQAADIPEHPSYDYDCG